MTHHWKVYVFISTKWVIILKCPPVHLSNFCRCRRSFNILERIMRNRLYIKHTHVYELSLYNFKLYKRLFLWKQFFIGRPKYSCSKWLYGCSVLSMVVQICYFWTRKNGRDNPTPLLNNHRHFLNNHRHFFEQPWKFFWTTVDIFLNNPINIFEQPYVIIWTTQIFFRTRKNRRDNPTPFLNKHRHFFEQPWKFFWTTLFVFLNNPKCFLEQP